jgi:DNA-binding response OmpR family regulator
MIMTLSSPTSAWRADLTEWMLLPASRECLLVRPVFLLLHSARISFLKRAQNLNIDYLEKPISLADLVSRIKASTTPSTP